MPVRLLVAGALLGLVLRTWFHRAARLLGSRRAAGGLVLLLGAVLSGAPGHRRRSGR